MNYQKGKLQKKSCTISLNTIKFLEINLDNEVKDLYSENYKTLKNYIEEDTNN